MQPDILQYNNRQTQEEQIICHQLAEVINQSLPEAESKIWHAHPVWFLEGNPIVGYSKLKSGIRLLFWSGVTFEEKIVETGKRKIQRCFYNIHSCCTNSKRRFKTLAPKRARNPMGL